MRVEWVDGFGGGGRKGKMKEGVWSEDDRDQRDGDTTSKEGSGDGGEGDERRRRERRKHQAAKADRRGKDGWVAQPRLHWDRFDWNRWGVGEVNDGWW